MTNPMRTALLVAVLLVVATGCKDAETRAREAQEKIMAQLADPMATALAQELPAAKVEEAQRHLQVLREYLGEINGELDSVTVNAIQAFQDSHGLPADGMLTGETLDELRQAAAHRQS
jgi:peptidoglycan hydrolase-like protein with peptidoglycan-binding domain